MSIERQYADRDPIELGNHYLKHINHMTWEGLHDKSSIAAELAWRDVEIERLKQGAFRASNLIAGSVDEVQKGEVTRLVIAVATDLPAGTPLDELTSVLILGIDEAKSAAGAERLARDMSEATGVPHHVPEGAHGPVPKSFNCGCGWSGTDPESGMAGPYCPECGAYF